MSLSILTNVSAMQTEQNLLNSSNAVSQSMQRLSSGLRINTAADDAAGYAISENLTSQVNGLDQASRNTNDAVSMVQTASGSLTTIQDMLQRVRELAVQYNNGSNSNTDDQTAIQDEVDQLTNEISREAGASNFNGINLLNGSAGTGGSVTFQVGANDGDTMQASFAGVTSAISTAASGFTWANAGSSTAHVLDLSATGSLSQIDSAITAVSTQAATLGAVQNRLQYTSDSISTTEQNLSASNSQIKDVNMAQEMTNLTQQQILEQAGTAMLAQAQQQPQLILKLLQG
jgi:flagellin